MKYSEDVMNQRMMVDPPSGWLYGFPKEFQAYRLTGGLPLGLDIWLGNNGYPQSEINQWPDGVPCWMWYEDVE